MRDEYDAAVYVSPKDPSFVFAQYIVRYSQCQTPLLNTGVIVPPTNVLRNGIQTARNKGARWYRSLTYPPPFDKTTGLANESTCTW